MTIYAADDRWAKLPKYAQEELVRLNRIVSDLQRALKEQQQDVPSKIRWGRNFMPNRATGYLPDDEIVEYQVCASPHRIIRVRLDETGLRVSGDNRLEIICESSNCFTITERA
jgi:hypothetical protein